MTVAIVKLGLSVLPEPAILILILVDLLVLDNHNRHMVFHAHVSAIMIAHLATAHLLINAQALAQLHRARTMMGALVLQTPIVSLKIVTPHTCVLQIVQVDHPWQIHVSVLLIPNVIQDIVQLRILVNLHAPKLMGKDLTILDVIVKAIPNVYLDLVILIFVGLIALALLPWP